MRGSFLTSVVALSACAFFAPMQVDGANIVYAPQSGATVNFTSITESSMEPTTQVPLNGLYGQPTAYGDVLVFDNLNFRAQSTGPQRDFDFVDFVDGQLNLTIAAKANQFISTLLLSEDGDYTLQQSLIAPNAAAAQVIVPTVIIRVLERNGSPVAPTTYYSPMTFSTGSLFSITASDPSEYGVFSGSAAVNLVSLTGFSDITRIAVSYDNQLYAESLPNASAAIAKKGVTVEVGTDGVPEPATLSIFGGLAGFALLRRRRNALEN